MNDLLVNSFYFLEQMQTEQQPLSASSQDTELAKSTTSCYVCGKDKDGKKRLAVRHHDHYMQNPILWEDAENHSNRKRSESEQLITFICSICNLSMYPLRKIPVFSHGLSMHVPFILRNCSENGLKDIRITPHRQSDKIISLTIKNKVLFLDAALQFGETSLKQLFSWHSDKEFEFFQNNTTEKEFPLLRKMLPFPHTHVKTFEDLDCGFPGYADFKDIRYLNELEQADYENAFKAYTDLNCQNLRCYAKIVLRATMYGLANILLNYSEWTLKSFGLHSLYDLSAASFSCALLHFYCKADYEHIRDERIYRLLSPNSIGGLSLCNVHHVEAKSARFGDTVNPEETCEILHLDFSALYGSILGANTPYKNYHVWSSSEISSFDLSCVDENDEKDYLLCVTVIYPNDIHKLTSDLPLAFSRPHMVVHIDPATGDMKNESCKSTTHQVDLSTRSKSGVWYHHKLLKLFLSLGLVLKEITGIVSYETKNQFQPFHQKCMEKWKTGNKLYAKLGKMFLNLSCGKFLEKLENTGMQICTSKNQAYRLLSKTKLLEATPLAENLSLITTQKNKSKPMRNILIGFHVLQLAKLKMYEAWYCHIQKLWKDKVRLCYSEVDSFVLRLVGVTTLENDLKRLSPILDLSTVPKDVCPNLYSEENAGKPGMLRFEAWAIRSFISLKSKSYSLLIVNLQCKDHLKGGECSCISQICKGLRKRRASHEKFRQVLKTLNSEEFEYEAVTAKGLTLKIVTKKRRMLSMLDSSSRVWKGNESVPIGYMGECY